MRPLAFALFTSLALSGCAVGATGYASGAMLPIDDGWNDPGTATVARIPPARPEAQAALPGDRPAPRHRTSLVRSSAPVSPWMPSDPGWRAPQTDDDDAPRLATR